MLRLWDASSTCTQPNKRLTHPSTYRVGDVFKISNSIKTHIHPEEIVRMKSLTLPKKTLRKTVPPDFSAKANIACSFEKYSSKMAEFSLIKCESHKKCPTSGWKNKNKNY